MEELATAGAFALAESPISRFFLTPDYRSPIISRTLTIHPEEMPHIRAVGVGTSYVYGQGGESPVTITARTVRDAGVANWQATVTAVSGSRLDDVPRQTQQACRELRPSEVPIVITDSGYNSFTERLLEDRDTLQNLTTLLHILDNFSPRRVPELITRFNAVCEAFFVALTENSKQLEKTLTYLAQTLSGRIYVYEYPPLQYAPNITRVGRRHDPEDTSVTFPIAGDPTRELLAQRIAALGTNATEHVLESLHLQFPHVQFVPVDLQAALHKADFTGKKVPDEHPNPDGYNHISDQQLAITVDGGELLSKKIRRIMQ